MKKRTLTLFITGGSLVALFAILIVLLKTVDVAAVGPNGSEVGFSSLNKSFSDLVGQNEIWLDVTGYLGYCLIGVAAAFALLAVVQAVRRKSIRAVDRDLLLLVGFDLIIVALYLLFDLVAVNYRPVLENGELAASFPSTHTMIALFVAATASYQAKRRLRPAAAVWIFGCCVSAIAAVTVVGRVLSGVHWLTDIIGGILVSLGVSVLYFACCSLMKDKAEKTDA